MELNQSPTKVEAEESIVVDDVFGEVGEKQQDTDVIMVDDVFGSDEDVVVEEQTEPEPTNTSADVLEWYNRAEELSLNPAQKTVRAAQEASRGGNLRELYPEAFGSDDELTQIGVVEDLIKNPNIPDGEKIALIHSTRPEFLKADTRFGDFKAGAESLSDRKLTKSMNDSLNDRLTPEQEKHALWQYQWEKEKIAQLGWGLNLERQIGSLMQHPIEAYKSNRDQFRTEEEEEKYNEVFWDNYAYQIMYLPELVHGVFDEEAKAEMAAFKKLVDAKAEKIGVDGKLAVASSTTLSLVADPLLDVGSVVAGGAIKAARALKAGRALTKSLGRFKSMAILKASPKSVARFLVGREGTKEFKELEKIAFQKSTNPLSSRLRKAFDILAEGKMSEEVAMRPVVSAGAEGVAKAVGVGDVKATESISKDVIDALKNPNTKKSELVFKTIDTREATPLVVLPDVPPSMVSAPISDLGVSLNNAQMVGEAVATKSEFDFFKKVTQRVFGKRNLNQYIDDAVALRFNREDGTISAGLGAEPFKGKKGFFNHYITSTFYSSRHTFKDPVTKEALVVLPAHLRKIEQRINKGAHDILNRAFGNVSKDERVLLEHLIQTGSDYQTTFKSVPGGLVSPDEPGVIIPCSEKVKDSYFAIRRAYDHAYDMVNQTAVNEMKLRGVLFDQNTQELAVKVGKKDKDEALAMFDTQGKEVHEIPEEHNLYLLSDGGNLEAPRGYLVARPEDLGEIPSDFKPFGAGREGYSPVLYADDLLVSRVKVGDNGLPESIERVATAKTTAEVMALNKRLGVKKGDNVYYIGERQAGKVTELVDNNGFVQDSTKLTAEQFEQLLKQLEEVGASENLISSMQKSYSRYGVAKKNFLKQRKKRLVSAKTAELKGDDLVGEPASIKSAPEAMSHYMNEVANYVTHTEYMTDFKIKFLDDYGNYLSDPTDLFSEIKAGVSTSMRAEIEGFRSQIKNITRRKSSFDKVVEQHRTEVLDSLASKDTLASQTGYQILKKVPSLSKITGGIKNFSRVSVMGLGAIFHLILQPTAAYLNSMGVLGVGKVLGGKPLKAVKIAARGHADLVELLVSSTTKGKAHLTSRGDMLRKQIIASGVLDDFALDDLVTSVVPHVSQSPIKKVGKKLWHGASGYAVLGEKLNQVIGWTFAKAEIDDAIQKGIHSTLKKSDMLEGKSVYLHDINKRGTLLAHEMSNVTRPRMSQSDIGSLIYLFKRFGFDHTALMTNMGKELKKGEVVGLWATYGTLLGAGGIPYYADITNIAEGVENYFGVIPNNEGKYDAEVPYEFVKSIKEKADKYNIPCPSIKTMFRGYTGGAIQVASDGYLQLAPRMANQALFTSWLESKTVNEGLGEEVLGVAGSVIANYARTGKQSVSLLYNTIEQEGMPSPQSIKSVVRKALEPVAGISRMEQGVVAKLTGDIRDKKGNLLKRNATLKEVALLMAGELPGDVRNIQNYNYYLRRKSRILSQWVGEQADKAAEMFIEGDEKSAQVILNATYRELDEQGLSKNAITLMKRVLAKIESKSLTPKEKLWFDKVIEADSEARILEFFSAGAGDAK